MSGILAELASRHNLTANRTQAWGTVDGFWFQIALPSSGFDMMKILTSVNLPDEASAAIVANGLADMAKTNPAISYVRRGGAVEISLRKPSGAAGVDLVDAILLRLVSLFRRAGAAPACCNCEGGKPAEDKGNYLKGFAGALAGALIGSLVWVLIGYLGFIAAIGGIVISFCAIKGYQLMKGKINAPSIIALLLICVVVMVLAQFAVTDIEVCKAVASQGYQVNYWNVILHTFEIPFTSPEDARIFITNLALGFLLLALGSWRLIRSLYVQAKTPISLP